MIAGRHGESPIIQWDVTYNGFELLLCEIETLLDQASHGAGRWWDVKESGDVMFVFEWFVGINCIILLSQIQFYSDALSEQENMILWQ